MGPNKSIEFFDGQFQRQFRERDFALNPFETVALDYLTGTVLDLGAGLGNLSLAAGRRGHQVVAVDASPTAVARINADAQNEGIPVRAIQAEVSAETVDASYDTIVAIGLLMFFGRQQARAVLDSIAEHVAPGGRAIINVLIEGTTFLGMFDPENYYLFRPRELEERFEGWNLLLSRFDTFPAPEETKKEFSTVIVQKPFCSAGARLGASEQTPRLSSRSADPSPTRRSTHNRASLWTVIPERGYRFFGITSAWTPCLPNRGGSPGRVPRCYRAS
ncbi:MAG: SAM-dependent methyltransferase [Planctomycetaceae bacterium]